MSPESVVELVFITLLTGGFAALFWTRLNQLEAKLDRTATHEDLVTFRTEVREEIGQMRDQMATMRSDLTHIALAVGARQPPRSIEG